MSSEEAGRMSGRRGVRWFNQSRCGNLAAAIDARKIPGVLFGPFRDEDFPVILCILLCIGFTLLAYLMFS